MDGLVERVSAALASRGLDGLRVDELRGTARATWRDEGGAAKVIVGQLGETLLLFGAICREPELDPRVSALWNARLAAGAIILNRGWYLLRCTVPAAHHESTVVCALVFVAHEVRRLRGMLPRTPGGSDRPSTPYAD